MKIQKLFITLLIGLGLLILTPNVSLASSDSLAIDVTGPATVTVNQEATYQINWWVTAEGPVSDIMITYFVPEHATFVSASDSGMESGGLVTWTLGEMNAPVSGSFSVTVKVTGPVYEWDLVLNKAQITTAGHGSVETIFSSAIDAHCLLTLNKSVNAATVAPNGSLEYTITVGNEGEAICTGGGVELIEAYDPAITPESYSLTPGKIDAPLWCADRTLPAGYEDLPSQEVPFDYWKWLEILPGNQEQVVIATRVSADVVNGQVLKNRVCADAYEVEPLCRTTETTVVTEGDGKTFHLNLTKSAATSVWVGDNLTYNLVWSVSGEATATAVTLVDSLPADVDFVSASASGVYATGTVTWLLGDVVPNATGTAEVIVAVKSVPEGGKLINTAEVTSGVIKASANVETAVQEKPFLLTLVKTAPANVKVGEQVAYTIDWSVTGSETAANLTLVDTLPAGADFVSASSGAVLATGTVTWLLGDLTPNASGTATVIVSAPDTLANTTLTNVALISSGVFSATSTADTLVTSSVTPPPVCTVNCGGSGPSYGSDIIYDYPATKKVGERVAETVTLKSTGTGPLPAGIMRLNLPIELILISADPTWASYNTSTNEAVWNVSDLASDATFTVKLVIEPLQKGEQVKTLVTYDNWRAPTSRNGEENITDGEPPIVPPVVPPIVPPVVPPIVPPVVPPVTPPLLILKPTPTPIPAPRPIIPPAVAGEKTEPTEEGQGAEIGCISCPALATAKAACTLCGWWLWAVLALLHIAVLYSFYLINKARKDEWWGLPVILILSIAVLLLFCQLQPWWLIVLIEVTYFIGLFDYYYLLKRTRFENMWWLTYVLVAMLLVLIVLTCGDWRWWFVVVFTAFFLASLVTAFYQVMRSDNKIWWLNPIFFTLLIASLEVIVKVCQCGLNL